MNYQDFDLLIDRGLVQGALGLTCQPEGCGCWLNDSAAETKEPLIQLIEPERSARVALDGAPHVARRRLP